MSTDLLIKPEIDLIWHFDFGIFWCIPGEKWAWYVYWWVHGSYKSDLFRRIIPSQPKCGNSMGIVTHKHQKHIYSIFHSHIKQIISSRFENNKRNKKRAPKSTMNGCMLNIDLEKWRKFHFWISKTKKKTLLLRRNAYDGS